MTEPTTPGEPTDGLAIDTSHDGAGAALVVVVGRLDAVEAPELDRVLDALVGDGDVRLQVDLTDVTFLDSAGLAVLVRARRRARGAGGDVELVRPRSEEAMRVFRLTQFDQVFRMHARREP